MAIYRVRTALSGIPIGPSVSTMFFDAAGGTAQQAADAVADFWQGLSGAMNPVLNWDVEDQVDQLGEVTGNLAGTFQVVGDSGAGAGGAGDYLSPAIQGLLRWHTGGIVHNRAVVGQTFVPGAGENVNGAGVPVSTYLDALNTAGANLVAAASAQLVVWSRPFAGGPSNPARSGTIHVVTSAAAWNKWAVLRSRRD